MGVGGGLVATQTSGGSEHLGLSLRSAGALGREDGTPERALTHRGGGGTTASLGTTVARDDHRRVRRGGTVARDDQRRNRC